MISYTTQRFRKALIGLPKTVRKQAERAYRKFRQDPYHPSLHFKRIHSREPIYTVRIDRNYRAVGVWTEKEIVWFWIGSHADYDRLLSSF